MNSISMRGTANIFISWVVVLVSRKSLRPFHETFNMRSWSHFDVLRGMHVTVSGIEGLIDRKAAQGIYEGVHDIPKGLGKAHSSPPAAQQQPERDKPYDGLSREPAFVLRHAGDEAKESGMGHEDEDGREVAPMRGGFGHSIPL